MSLNSAIMSLYGSRFLCTHYQQHISSKLGFCIDSAYINYITVNKDDVIIELPYQIDIISNIIVSNAKFELLCDNKIISVDSINLKKFKNVKIRVYDIKNFNDLEIYYDVYIFKNKLKSLL